MFVGASVLTIFGAHALHGALTSTASLLVVSAWSLILLAGLANWRIRAQFSAGPALAWAAILMAIVIAAAAFSIVPGAPFEGKAAWLQVGAPAAVSLDTSATAIEIVNLFGLACAFLVGIELGCDVARARAALNGIVYAGVVFAIAAAAIFELHLAPQSQHDRLEALFMNPDTAGTLFGALLVLAVAQAIRGGEHRAQTGGRLPYGSLACCVVLSAVLLLTQSRGAILATTLALAGFVVVETGGRLGRLRAVAVAAAIFPAVALLAVLLDPHILTRFGSIDADAGLRDKIYQVHWQAFLRSPLFGYGLGDFDLLNQTLLTDDTYAKLWNIRSAENVYLQWLEEAGIVGAIPMFACVATIIATTALNGLERRRMRSWINALLAVDVVFVVHGYTDFALETPSIAGFWACLLGLQYGLSAPRAKR